MQACFCEQFVCRGCFEQAGESMSLKGPLTDDVCELPLPEQNEAERAEAQSESLDTELIDNAACGHDRLRELATGTPPSATEEGAGQHTDGMDHDPHCAEGQDMETEESEGAGTVDQCTEELPKQEVLSWAPHNKVYIFVFLFLYTLSFLIPCFHNMRSTVLFSFS